MVRIRQENGTRHSTRHSGQTTRAKPFSGRPQARNASTALVTMPRRGPDDTATGSGGIRWTYKSSESRGRLDLWIFDGRVYRRYFSG